jgi:xanthine dehydrogenase YagR molybdenum-binding subunit
VAVNADVPHFEVIFADEVDPILNSIGSRGMGEVGLVGFAAAVANAFFLYIGKKMRELQITPDQLIS